MKQVLAAAWQRTLEKFLPELERARRPARVQLVRAVVHPANARLAAGAGAAVARAILIEQRHPAPGLAQAQRRPRAKDAGPYNHDIEALAHSFCCATYARIKTRAATRSSSAHPRLLNSVMSASEVRTSFSPATSWCRSATIWSRAILPVPIGISRSPASASAPS